MKRIVSLIVALSVVLLVLTSIATAEVPTRMHYQGHLTDADGAPLDTTIAMTFTIYDDSIGPNDVWTETQPSVTVTNGLFNALLGSVNPITDDVFADTVRWLGITVGSDPEITPRTRLVSVPYAMRVATVDGSTGGVISGDVDIQSDLTVSGKATIGPGHTNTGTNAFVAGEDNTASGSQATVSGLGNTTSGSQATVGGGVANDANGNQATVGGGQNNGAYGNQATVGGGVANTASGNQSTIGGGQNNTASGNHSAIPGGRFNTALATNAFAAGSSAKANHKGSVVIAANSGLSKSDSVRSGGKEQMVLRADGNIYITNTSGLAPYDATKLINTSSGAYLTTGGTWTDGSSRTLKQNFQPLGRQELLGKISSLPVEAWQYKNSDERHIGPVSEDFVEAFDVGTVRNGRRDDKYLSPGDVAGVALAGVKELAQQNQELRQIIEELRQRIEELEKVKTLR